MQPINYTLDVENPINSALKGMQVGFALQDREMQQQQLGAQQQQQQMVMQQQLQMQKDLADLSNKENPTAQDYARVSTRYPQMAEQLKKSWEPLDEEQKRNRIDSGVQLLSAIKSGNIDIARDLLKLQSEAAKNSGNEAGAKAAESIEKTLSINPKIALNSAALSLSAVMGPDKFAEILNALTKVDIEAEKLGAEAQIKGLEAANAPTKIALENENMFQDAETKKLNREISVFDSKIKSADNEIKREQLAFEREKLVVARDEKLQEKQIEAQNQLDSITTGMNAVNAVMESPLLKQNKSLLGKVLPDTGVGSILRLALQNIPGTEAKDLNALIEPLKSQQFLNNLMALKGPTGSTGLGALTQAEGDRLEKAIASLDPNQSPAAFKTALKTIKTTLERAQAKLVGKGNLPKTNKSGGSTFVMNHPKYGEITDSVINKLLTQKPGMTREQAIQFFKDSGGQ